MALSKNLKVLIVDDIDSMRKVIKNMLKQIGFDEIDEAKSGDKAWIMLEQAQKENQPYQLILSDWAMPKMNGLDLLKKIRNTDELKKVPFLMITAASEQDNVVKAMKEGVSDFIIKPFSSGTLKNKVENILARQKS